jgi:uncharacterized protein YbaR (Trm112 family)
MPEATLMIEMYYHCPECFSKHTLSVNMYKNKKSLGTDMVEVCHDCGELFEIKDRV